jgi:5-methylcytosine-specific restriction endonuclease McrA
MKDLARRVLELYWPQTRRHPTTTDVLRQNRGGQAQVITAIALFKDAHGLDPRSSIGHAGAFPEDLGVLLREVELKLARQPVPLLQRIGGQTMAILYRIGWEALVPAPTYRATDQTIHLLPGVGENLIAVAPMLREIVHGRWLAAVAEMNRDVLERDDLEAFLFGVDRVALGPLVAPFRELGGNRCFYCRRPLTGPVEVDHFLPWMRYTDDGIDNLVLTDRACNNSKRQYPAAGEHVVRWVERISTHATALSTIANERRWESHRTRTLAYARDQYLVRPIADVRLWLAPGQFVVAQNDLLVIGNALRAG